MKTPSSSPDHAAPRRSYVLTKRVRKCHNCGEYFAAYRRPKLCAKGLFLYDKQKTKDRIAQRLAAGECPRHGIKVKRPVVAGRKLCADCLRKMSDNWSEKYRALIEEGLCISCRHPNDTGRSRCSGCIKYHNEQAALSRKRRLKTQTREADKTPPAPQP